MNYGDGPHDATKFLRESTRPRPLSEADKMVQFLAIKSVSNREMTRPCTCTRKQNCWNCVPAHPWTVDAKSLEIIYTMSANYSTVIENVDDESTDDEESST